MNLTDEKDYKILPPGKNLKEKAKMTKDEFKNALVDIDQNLGKDISALNEKTNKNIKITSNKAYNEMYKISVEINNGFEKAGGPKQIH